VGGTLLSPHPSVGEIYAEVLLEHRIVARPEILNEGFRKAWKASHRVPRIGLSEESERKWWREVVYQTVAESCEGDRFEEVFDHLWVTFAETRRWRLHEGAMEMLRELKTRGYRLGVISNWDNRLLGLLDGLAISPWMESVVISSQVGFEKPDPRIFQAALSQFRLEPRQMLHVGDSDYHDIEPARRIGWKTLKIENGPASRNREDCISTLHEILVLLPSDPMRT